MTLTTCLKKTWHINPFFSLNPSLVIKNLVSIYICDIKITEMFVYILISLSYITNEEKVVKSWQIRSWLHGKEPAGMTLSPLLYETFTSQEKDWLTCRIKLNFYFTYTKTKFWDELQFKQNIQPLKCLLK